MERKRVLKEEGEEFVEEKHQPVSKRRTIRSYYRQIEDRINVEKDELEKVGSRKFIDIINEVDSIHQDVKKPREQVADAETLFGLTKTLVASVRTHASGDITPAEFVSCLIREFEQRKTTNEPLFAKSHSISWEAIGSCVSPIFKNGSGCMTMFGPMKNELKPRKVYVRSTRTRTTTKARPAELEKAAVVVSDTDQNMHMMFEILKVKKKVKVENLMLNRNSFAETIENLFALSFLVKDGRVQIDVDESGSHFAVPRNAPGAEEIKSGAVKTHQFIFRLGFDDWKLMKTVVAEGEEVMATRSRFAEAIVESSDRGCCKEEAIASESELAYSAGPVKKLSRNYMARTNWIS